MIQTEKISRLLECRDCGGITRHRLGGCPYCGYNDTEEVEVGSLEGGTTTAERPWYRVLEIQPREDG